MREPSIDGLFAERNMLVGALSKLFPAWIATDPAEPEWPVVYVQLPTGQVSWHIIATERYSVFPHLLANMPGAPKWNGHDDAEKWRRVSALSGPEQWKIDDALLNRIRTLLHMWWDWEASRDRLTTPPSESKAWMALSDERAEILREIHTALLRHAGAGRSHAVPLTYSEPKP